MDFTEKEIEILENLIVSEQLRMKDIIKNSNGITYTLDELDNIYFKLME